MYRLVEITCEYQVINIPILVSICLLPYILNSEIWLKRALSSFEYKILLKIELLPISKGKDKEALYSKGDVLFWSENI